MGCRQGDRAHSLCGYNFILPNISPLKYNRTYPYSESLDMDKAILRPSVPSPKLPHRQCLYIESAVTSVRRQHSENANTQLSSFIQSFW